MTPTEAIQQLVNILAETDPPFSDDDVYTALGTSGVPDDVADRTYKFAQLACGRKFLDGLGVSFSDQFICFNAEGNVIESGNIDEEPFFVAAIRFVDPDSVGHPAFSHFALMSADVHAVNDALNSGSNAADLVTAPAFLFLEPPTEAGLANAQSTISRHLAKLQADHPPPKRWWKFW